MKFVRVFLSIAIIAASIAWMVLELKKQTFKDYQIKWLSESTHQTPNSWELKQQILNKTKDYLSNLKLQDLELNESTINAHGPEKYQTSIESFLRDINLNLSNFDDFNKLQNEQDLSKKQKQLNILQSELEFIQTLEKQLSSFENTLIIESKSKTTSETSDGSNFSDKNETKKTTESETSLTDKQVTIAKVIKAELKDDSINDIFNELLSGNTEESGKRSVITHDFDDLMKAFQTLKTELVKDNKAKTEELNNAKNDILSKLESLNQKNIKAYQTQRELLENNLNSKNEKQIQLLNQNFNHKVQDIKNSLSIHFESLQESHTLERKTFLAYLNYQKTRIAQQLEQLFNTKEKTSQYGKLSLESITVELQLKDIRNEYWRCMLGFFTCLLFNFLWEIILQRNKF